MQLNTATISKINSNNNIKGSKILVIGGAGFIGSHVVEELLKEDIKEIIIYDNFARGTHKNIEKAIKDPRVRIFELGGDINQRDILDEAMKNTDYVFHLAALWLLHCHEYPRNAFHVNIEGTFNVLETALKHKVKKIIFSSSASVYGDALEIPMTENHPFNNKTFYGATKIACEQMFTSYFHRYGLNFIGLRYMNVYGERQDYRGVYVTVIMKILDKLDKNESPIVYGDGSQSYDFIHVLDVAKANVCALKSNTNQGFYNIGSGKLVSIKDLTENILELTGKKLNIHYEPAGQTFVTTRVGDPTNAKKDLGFSYYIELEQGLKQLIEWRKLDRCANCYV